MIRRGLYVYRFAAFYENDKYDPGKSQWWNWKYEDYAGVWL